MTNYILPPKPKKPQLIPVPLILVGVFIVIIILSGKINDFSGKKITILHTNDLMGQLAPFKETLGNKEVEVGGFARVATIVNTIRDTNPQAILIDAGDTIQGNLFTKVFGGIPLGILMSKLGYDAVCIGEHDFDEGPEGLRNYIKASNYPFLAANIDVSQSDALKGLIAPYMIKELNDGVKVGIFGLTTPEANLFAKTGRNVKVTDPFEAGRKAVEELRPKVDVIIALSHLGLTMDRDLAGKVAGIDVIVGGHSRTKLSIPVIIEGPNNHQTTIVQAKNQGRFVGKLVVAVKDKKSRVAEYKLIPINADVAADPEYEEKITYYEDRLKKETQKAIGRTAVDLDAVKSHIRTSETNLGDLFAKAIHTAFPEADFAFQNSGGIRSEEVFPKDRDITLADVWEWHPFANEIVLVTLTGKQVKEVLERGVSSLPISKGTFLQVDGLSYTVDLTGAPQLLSEDNKSIKFIGDRVIDIKVNGKPVNYNKNYRVAVNDFLLSGGDGFVTLSQAKDVVHTNKSLTEILVDYIKKHSPINIKNDGRIVVKGGLLR